MGYFKYCQYNKRLNPIQAYLFQRARPYERQEIGNNDFVKGSKYVQPNLN